MKKYLLIGVGYFMLGVAVMLGMRTVEELWGKPNLVIEHHVCVIDANGTKSKCERLDL